MSGVIAIWMTLFLGALAASGIVIAVGWRSRHVRGLPVMRDRCEIPNDPLWGEPEVETAALDAPAEVEAAIRLALKRVGRLIAEQSVKVDVAAPPGLLGRMRGAALVDLVEELLTVAIQGAPAGRLLLTAASHGDRIQVGVTDDVAGADPAIRAAGVRALMERVALRGGSLDINVRPTEGTTMTLRFAAAPGSWQDRTLPEPASREAGMRTTGAASPWMPFLGGQSGSR